MSRAILMVCVVAMLAMASAAMAADPAAPQTKEGTIKSVDAAAKSFILDRQPRELPFKTDEKTAFTLDGKESTFEAAMKATLKATVTYTIVSGDRIASKVEVVSAAAK